MFFVSNIQIILSQHEITQNILTSFLESLLPWGLIGILATTLIIVATSIVLFSGFKSVFISFFEWLKKRE